MASRLRDLVPPSSFVAECQRIMGARLAATSDAEREDTEWALTYAMQMHKAGRWPEYMAMRAEQEQ